ncbi:MAG: carbon-nitrogen hydrolase family protein, partial [Candidatus Margulisiibacteriota bacterium]
IKSASAQHADIIIFPEDFLTGGMTDKEIAQFADFNNKYLKIFQRFAKKYKIDIVPGSIIVGKKTGKYNTCYYIDHNGKLRGKYEKINLWLTERKHITAGNKISVFNTRFGKVGLAICWDLMWPEVFRAMAKKGVKVVFCPSLWYKGIGFEPYLKNNPNAEKDHINSLCFTRAIENNIVFIFVNAVGRMKSSGGYFDNAIGQSQITAPIVGLFNKPNNKEEMFIRDVDLDILNDAEMAYEIRRDLKTKL